MDWSALSKMLRGNYEKKEEELDILELRLHIWGRLWLAVFPKKMGGDYNH
jgi:hypothetical protein